MKPCFLILIGYFIPFLGDKASSAAILQNSRPESQKVIFSSSLLLYSYLMVWQDFTCFVGTVKSHNRKGEKLIYWLQSGLNLKPIVYETSTLPVSYYCSYSTIQYYRVSSSKSVSSPLGQPFLFNLNFSQYYLWLFALNFENFNMFPS
jgi:hypothetical protein